MYQLYICPKMLFEIELVEYPLLCPILQNGYSRLPGGKMMYMFANLFLIGIFKKRRDRLHTK